MQAPSAICLPRFAARPSALGRFTNLAAGVLLAAACAATHAATIAVQDFEASPATPTATYAPSGAGGLQTGSSTGAERPSVSPFYSGGAQSYQVNNGTATLMFDAISTSGYTGVQLTLRVAAFSLNTTANGLDVEDYVDVQISPDNGVNYYPTVRVAGYSASYWSYAGGTGNASTAYDGDAAVVVFAPAGSHERTTDGYSTVIITSLPSVGQLRFKIVMCNNSTNERWVIDDLQITGTVAAPIPTITLADNPAVCRGTTSASLTYSATTGSPDQYSIDFDSTAEAQGFADVALLSLPFSPISITVPGAAAAGTYSGALSVKNSTTGGVSGSYPISVMVSPLPAAPDAAYSRGPGASLKIKISDLTSDTIQGLGTASHGTVSQDDTYILYLPSVGDNNNDSFTYTAVNAYSCTKQATISVTVVPAAGQAQTPTVPPSGPVTVRFAGIPNYPYQAQRATDLDFTTGLRTWTTNAPGAGVFQIEDDFSDLGMRPSAAWYRLKYNP